MSALDPDRRRRLIAAARLLDSDKAGERQAAFEAVLRLLPDDDTLADLLERAFPEAPRVVPLRVVYPASAFRADLLRTWQRKAMDILARADVLNEKELDFVQKMAGARREPSDKQLAWLDDLALRVRRAA